MACGKMYVVAWYPDFIVTLYSINNLHQRIKDMRISPYSLLLAFLVIIICMTSCREPKALEYRDFKNLSSDKLGFSSSIFNIDLVYYNPNNFGLDLKQTNLDIYIDNNYLGHTEQDYQIHIPKKGEFTLPVKIDVDMKNAYKNALPEIGRASCRERVYSSV